MKTYLPPGPMTSRFQRGFACLTFDREFGGGRTHLTRNYSSTRGAGRGSDAERRATAGRAGNVIGYGLIAGKAGSRPDWPAGKNLDEAFNPASKSISDRWLSYTP
jgi:hypothetical protein